MADQIPSMLDMKLFKKASKVMILPMVIASLIIQFGLQATIFGFNISAEVSGSFSVTLLKLFLIVSIYLVKFAIPLWIAHNFLPIIHYITYVNKLQRSLISVLPLLPITVAAIGFFGKSSIASLNEINVSWFYTAFVLGFYLMAVEEDINYETSRNEDGNSYPKRNFPFAFR